MALWAAPSHNRNAALSRAIDQSMAVISFDVDGKILEVNDNFLKTTGYQSADVIGQHHRIFVPAVEADQESYRTFWAALRQGHFQEGEFHRIDRNGRNIWLQATYNPITDARGRVIRIVKLASDITDEKRRSMDDAGQISAIQRSQAVIAFDMNGIILEANDNFLRVMSYDARDITGQHHRLFVSPDEAASPAYVAFWEALRRGEFQAGEYRRIAKGGREVWIRATYNPIMDDHGQPVKVVKFAMDVTAEKRRNADYEGQIAAINRTQAVIAFTLDGTILEANDNFLDATGYRIDEVKGQHHHMFVARHYAESEEYRQFWERLSRGEASSAIYQRFGKGGKPVWLQATYNPILDANGHVVKVVKYANDISASMGARSRAVEAAEDTLNNVETVAAAAEEMNATVSEIAVGMLRTKAAVDQIHARTGAAGRSTGDMRQAAQSMDGVVQLIAQVAGQINLLALNATIESARAGEAGRGFAVVANEVKILAGQTSAATTRISQEIAGMQSLSDQVASALDSITSALDEVQGFVDNATSSIQEQSAATNEISANMHVAAEGVADIGRNLDEWIIGMEERRFDQRLRSAKPARLHMSGKEPLSCSTRNISKSGAKLAIGDTRGLPDVFDLEIVGEPGMRRCRIIRRGKGEIGVRFE